MNEPIGRRAFVRMSCGGAASAALAGAAPTRGRACILVWQRGGASHLDTFDMKPDAPREIRGDFRPIRTSAPGIWICEHLPRTARLAHKLAIVRSLHSAETNHERAAFFLRTGQPFSISGQHAPLRHAAAIRGRAGFRERCLEAADLVERGSRFVTLVHDGYDTHSGQFSILRDRVLPEFDRGFSALVRTLDERGLLDETLVAVLTEFGRTPRLNPAGGRDHHSRAWSAVLAGAGAPGGAVIGATDRTGSEVIDSPVSPGNLARTIAQLAGLDAFQTAGATLRLS